MSATEFEAWAKEQPADVQEELAKGLTLAAMYGLDLDEARDFARKWFSKPRQSPPRAPT